MQLKLIVGLVGILVLGLGATFVALLVARLRRRPTVTPLPRRGGPRILASQPPAELSVRFARGSMAPPMGSLSRAASRAATPTNLAMEEYVANALLATGTHVPTGVHTLPAPLQQITDEPSGSVPVAMDDDAEPSAPIQVVIDPPSRGVSAPVTSDLVEDEITNVVARFGADTEPDLQPF